MREILFRGQQRRKGEKVRLDGTPVESKWVYGGYCQYNEERGIIYQSEPEIDKYSVYADTVGQYTGLTDKNGSKIFEGDIVQVDECYKYLVPEFKFGITDPLQYWKKQKVEVIGNIHDNPELLDKE